MTDLPTLQKEYVEWRTRELSGEVNEFVTAGKVCAEAGELMDATIKNSEIRNDGIDWEAEQRKEMGDVLIALLGAAWAKGWDLEEVANERWNTIKERKFATRNAE